MFYDSRPIIIDLSAINGEPSSACQHKTRYLTGISWEFASDYESNSNEQIVLRNDCGSCTLVSRELDGKRGFLYFSAQPIAAGKFKMRLRTKAGGSRRVHVICWISGERVDVQSIDLDGTLPYG